MTFSGDRSRWKTDETMSVHDVSEGDKQRVARFNWGNEALFVFQGDSTSKAFVDSF